MDLRRTSDAPTREEKLEVVTLQQVKAQARVRHGDEDDLLAGYVETAYDHLSGPAGWLNGYCLRAETYEFYVPALGPTLELPLRPVVDLGSIAVAVLLADGSYGAPAAGSSAAVNDDDFAVIASLSATAFRRDGLAPNPRAFRITFSAGHDNPDDVPTPLKQAILLLASHWYANREATAGGQGASVPQQIEFGLVSLAGRYRVSPDHS